jgi:RNA polymerase sigma-70 factor (ECF subfamily)
MLKQTAAALSPTHAIANEREPAEERAEQLVLRVDAENFVNLYLLYLNPVHSYLYARLGNRQEAEDVTSVAFERAWSSIANYAPTGSFKAWLFTIVNRSLADYYRSRKPTHVEVDSLADTLPDGGKGPEDTVIASEQVRHVMSVMSALSPEQQEIIALRFLGELRYKEIADILGKSEAAVKMAAYRGLDEMRRLLGELGFGNSDFGFAPYPNKSEVRSPNSQMGSK